MARRPTTAAKKSVVVDFTGVEGRVVVPEGDYTLKVSEIKREVGDKADYFAWKFAIVGPKHEGVAVYHNTSLAPQSLWNLRNLLETLGVEVPDGPLEIEFDELVDVEVGATIIHEDYEGKKRMKIGDFFMLPEEADAAAGAEPESPKATVRATKPKLEKLKADDVSEMGEDELAGVIEKYGLKVDLDQQKSLRKKVNAVLDALEASSFLEE